MDKKTDRLISKEVLGRIENASSWDAGNKVLKVEIDYKKEAYRNRPRGYYLCLSVYLETDRGFTQHCLSFGDEGDPHSEFLLEETKAFSQKKFDAVVVDPVLLATRVEQMKAEYVRRRDLKKARQAQERERFAEVN